MASKPLTDPLSTFIVTSTFHIPQVVLRTYLENLPGEVLTIEALTTKQPAGDTPAAALVKMAGINAAITPTHTLPSGEKMQIRHLFSESTTFTLRGPAADALRNVALEIATEWKLNCTTPGNDIIVSGPIENVYQFRLKLDDYVKNQLAEGDPAIPSLLMEQSPHLMGAQANSLDGSPETLSSSSSGQRFTGLSPDVLSLLDKLPEGEIPGVQYNVKEGVVCIDSESKEELEDRISKFQEAYQNILSSSSRRLKVEVVEVPGFLDHTQAATIVASFSEKYTQCVFSYHEDPRVIKVVSNSSRQFDQAKKLLHDQLRSSIHPLHSAPSPAAAMTGFSAHEVIYLPFGRSFTLKKANIVKEQVDIIVNAANGRLMHAGGVAGALDAASHGWLQKYSDAIVQKKGIVPVGEIALTHVGGGLKCKYVIHAVGPDSTFPPNECKRLLAQVINKAIIASEKSNVTSIAFPAISSGIFGVNQDLVAATIIDTILTHQFTKPSPVLSDIRIVIIDNPKHTCFARHFIQRRAHFTQQVSEPPTEYQSAGLGQFGAGNNTSSWSEPPVGQLVVPADGTTNQGATNEPPPSHAALPQGGEPPPFSPHHAALPQDGVSDVANSATKPHPFMRQNSSPAAISPTHSPHGKLLTMADLQQLTTHLQSLGPKWKRLGLILGFHPDILAQVSEGEATSDLLVYLKRMLTMWLQQKDHPPTLEALIKALSSEPIGEHNLAQLLQGHANQYGLAAGANPIGGVSYPALPPTTDLGGSSTDASPHTTTVTAAPHAAIPTAVTVSPHTTTFTAVTASPHTTTFTASTATTTSMATGVTPGVSVTIGQDPLTTTVQTSTMYSPPITTGTMTYSAAAGGGGGTHTSGSRKTVTTQPRGGKQQHGGKGGTSAAHTHSSKDHNKTWSPSGASAAAKTTASSSSVHSNTKDDNCPICLDAFKNPTKTSCGHAFCSGCLNRAMQFDPYCPTCKKPLRTIVGKQPKGGHMTHRTLYHQALPGYHGYNTIEIHYTIPSGTQGPEHPNPGRPYSGTSRTAYLPDSQEGREILKLLRKSFDARLTFTVGTSVTSGIQNTVVWNDIHHKTNIHGGPQSYGYPDPTYLKRVKDDLAAKGIVPDSTSV